MPDCLKINKIASFLSYIIEFKKYNNIIFLLKLKKKYWFYLNDNCRCNNKNMPKKVFKCAIYLGFLFGVAFQIIFCLLKFKN